MFEVPPNVKETGFGSKTFCMNGKYCAESCSCTPAKAKKEKQRKKKV